MCEFNPKNAGRRIDECMKQAILLLNPLLINQKTLACCCGHKKYVMTIVLQDELSGVIWELFSGKKILRKKRFYKRDEEGYYFIPEVINEKG